MFSRMCEKSFYRKPLTTFLNVFELLILPPSIFRKMDDKNRCRRTESHALLKSTGLLTCSFSAAQFRGASLRSLGDEGKEDEALPFDFRRLDGGNL